MNSELYSDENVSELAWLLLRTWGYKEATIRAYELITPPYHKLVSTVIVLGINTK